MSYDFRLFKLSPGVSLEEAARADEPEEGAPGPRPTIPIEGTEREAVIVAITGFDPAAERFDGATHAEFTSAENGSGVQVTVFAREVSVTIPYWHKGEKAREVLGGVMRLLGSISRTGGLMVYDPQLGRALDPAADLEAVLAVYTHGSGALAETIQDPDAGVRIEPERRPWWKFW